MKAFLVIASEKPRPPLKGFSGRLHGMTALGLGRVKTS